ncbi:MAG: hypothetical protein V4503_03530 [Gemmatimonadota bacterium]
MRRYRVRALLTLLMVGIVASGHAQAQATLDSATLASFRWRNIGPANMQGRITDVEGIPFPSHTFFVASAGGGIWKTTNGGVSFRPVFEKERVVSMGDLAIAPSDTMQVWAGTGEEDSRNSISPGQGIYKSIDGGITWSLMGLEGTQAIGRILVHPRNPDVVWVAALGAPWNSNPDRGLYKTTDGGKNWRKVKFISDKAGFVDLAMDPTNPDILFASSWERVRGPYFLQSGGPGSALWKSTDGGETWAEVKGGGFPATTKGRIGIAIAPSDARVIYALVEADSAANPKGRKGVGTPAALNSGLYRSADGGATWTKMNAVNTRPFYYSQVRVDVKDPNRVYWSSTPVQFSTDGGKTVKQTTVGIHVDHHAMWLDPGDANHIVVGNDGGVGQSWDKGGNWQFLNTFAIGQFYEVSFDYATPYNICGGLQDNGSWCGPSRRRNGVITNAMWHNVGGGDGFYTAQDPTNPDIVYSESQGGAMGRLDLSTGQTFRVNKPSARARIAALEDSIAVLELDTAKAATSAVKKRIADYRSAIAADSAASELRWNWNTPYLLSPHNPTVFYAGANKVLKSVKQGEDLFTISPDLTAHDTTKIRISTRTTGGITTDATGAETFATITTLAESYVRPGLLYAGTDDGKVWLTRNDGGAWEELTGRFPGVPAGTYVVRIEPSYADTNTFYVAFDNHRVGDYKPYLYVTSDYGRTFRSIASNLPTGGVDFLHVVREDPASPKVLYVGSDVGAFVSVDAGNSWQKFMSGLPTVPVHDLKIQPRDRELIAGTHGRAIWVVDIAPMPQLADSATRAAKLVVFKPRTAVQYGERRVNGEDVGQAAFRGTSAPYGADIAYRVTGATSRTERASITILDVAGDTIQTLTGSGANGLQHVTWNFRPRAAPRGPLGPAALRDSIRSAKRFETVMDSLAKAGTDTASLARVRRILRPVGGPGQGGPGFGGGFGGPGGGQPQVGWQERPGESSGGGGRGRGGAAAAGADSALVRIVSELVAIPNLRGQGGFGGNGGGLVQTGDYLVIVRVGDKSERTTLRVERGPGADTDASFFEDHDDPGSDFDDGGDDGGGLRR